MKGHEDLPGSGPAPGICRTIRAEATKAARECLFPPFRDIPFSSYGQAGKTSRQTEPPKKGAKPTVLPAAPTAPRRQPSELHALIAAGGPAGTRTEEPPGLKLKYRV
ncbi:hypothetical protein Sfum_3871 [Syntrophobacter fumaroxidans MPOB]|uniref:Uncharacterized protein n=1 Tax=Syntrophobacter fumaroxidans (strain DSM 10017 / MPOB) TaxID=335543 RepID=A0LQ38_SYNFM|nr:hypothetical protein Sfum_3871 [Syntrophobacter fumaroxidans MPOB]